MKKIIALTLVLILAVGLFAGCKSSDKGSCLFPELQAGSRQRMAGTCQDLHRKDRRYCQGRHGCQRHL